MTRRRQEPLEDVDTGRDLVKNAADPQQVAHGARRERERARADENLWRWQLGQYEGRQFVWMLLKQFDLYASGVNLSRDQLFALEGKRDVGRRLHALITGGHPQAFLQMQQEAMARDARERNETAATRTPAAGDEAASI